MKKAIEEMVIEVLRERKWKVTTAESCTGGLLAGRLLNVSGASEVYEEGHITYLMQRKRKS
nr:CinA family protein [Coprococcus sp. AF21-14LB]